METSQSISYMKSLFNNDSILVNTFNVIARLGIVYSNIVVTCCVISTIKNGEKSPLGHEYHHSFILILNCILFGFILLRYIFIKSGTLWNIIYITFILGIACIEFYTTEKEFKIGKYLSKVKPLYAPEIISIILSLIFMGIVLYILYYKRNSITSVFYGYLVKSNVIVAISIIFASLVNFYNIRKNLAKYADNKEYHKTK